jgi:hypothetical protein
MRMHMHMRMRMHMHMHMHMVEWASFAARAVSHVVARAEPAVLARAEGEKRACRQRVAAWRRRAAA